MKTTNYTNTFIMVSPDYNSDKSKKEAKLGTIAALQIDILLASPYQRTSDDLLFEVYKTRNNIAPQDQEKVREAFFSKPQPCLRSSPLVKTHGFGIHHNENSKIAAIAIDDERYKQLALDTNISKTYGMRSKKS